MTTNAYYTALGGIINDVLARVLKDVLGLRDIPEVESQRLAALCRILHPLDELFVESADEVTLLSCFVETLAQNCSRCPALLYMYHHG